MAQKTPTQTEPLGREPLQKNLDENIEEIDLSLDTETKHRRRALNRARPNGDPSATIYGIPDDTTIKATGTDQFFDKNGKLQPPETTSMSPDERARQALLSLDANVVDIHLEQFDPDLYNHYQKLCERRSQSPPIVLLDLLEMLFDREDISFREGLIGLGFTDILPFYEIEIKQEETGTRIASDDDEWELEVPSLESREKETCPECGGDCKKYARQMRAADEGQTVFLTCQDCGWTGRKNS